LIEGVSDFLGFVTKAADEQADNVGAIFKMINGEHQFLCDRCTAKAEKIIIERGLRDLLILPEEEKKQLEEERYSDVINLPPIPGKFKNFLYADEFDLNYHLWEETIIQCEQCGKIIM
jgi:hypothetical protein